MAVFICQSWDQPVLGICFSGNCDVQEIRKKRLVRIIFGPFFCAQRPFFSRMEALKSGAVTDEKWWSFVVEQVFSQRAQIYAIRAVIAIYGAE